MIGRSRQLSELVLRPFRTILEAEVDEIFERKEKVSQRLRRSKSKADLPFRLG